MPCTTPFLMVYTTHINMVILGMVYYCFNPTISPPKKHVERSLGCQARCETKGPFLRGGEDQELLPAGHSDQLFSSHFEVKTVKYWDILRFNGEKEKTNEYIYNYIDYIYIDYIYRLYIYRLYI
jgi:hypothetical protein